MIGVEPGNDYNIDRVYVYNIAQQTVIPFRKIARARRRLQLWDATQSVCVRQQGWWWWRSFQSLPFFFFCWVLSFGFSTFRLPLHERTETFAALALLCWHLQISLIPPPFSKNIYIITKDSKIGDSISSVVVVVAPIPYNSFFVVFFCDGQVFQSRHELRRALWRHRGTLWGGRLLFYDGNSLVRLCSSSLLLYSPSGRIQCITSTGWAAITKNKKRRKEKKNARI